MKKIDEDDVDADNNRLVINSAEEVRNLNSGITSEKVMSERVSSSEEEPIDFDEASETDEKED